MRSLFFLQPLPAPVFSSVYKMALTWRSEWFWAMKSILFWYRLLGLCNSAFAQSRIKQARRTGSSEFLVHAPPSCQQSSDRLTWPLITDRSQGIWSLRHRPAVRTASPSPRGSRFPSAIGLSSHSSDRALSASSWQMLLYLNLSSTYSTNFALHRIKKKNSKNKQEL